MQQTNIIKKIVPAVPLADSPMKLSRTITLRGGRKIATLAEAVTLMSALPKERQLKPIWQTTAAMLLVAQASGNVKDMRHATAQLVGRFRPKGG